MFARAVLVWVAVVASGCEIRDDTETHSSRSALGTPALVKDINTNVLPNPGSGPTSFFPLGSRSVFAATTETEGNELWVTDGTANGTTMLLDIFPGSNGFFIGAPLFARLGSFAYFPATDGARGAEIWRTDGTVAGTQLAFELSFTQGGPAVDQFPVTWNGALVMTAFSAGTYSLVRSDGSQSGTTTITTLPARAVSLTPVGARLFFVLNESMAGTEVWTSDGTAVGTRVIDATPGTASSNPTALAAMGGSLYFLARPTLTQGELWRTDGTTTTRISTFNNFAPSVMVASGPLLYFRMQDTSTAASSLWVSDGTAAGTRAIAAPNPSGLMAPLIPNMVVFVGPGTEPWVSNGTDAGTFELRNISPSTTTLGSFRSIGSAV